MFRHSVETYKLRYSELFGDGDSKTHQKIKDVYGADGNEVVKQECIRHVQKRVKLKRDNPGLGGKGKLTDVVIDNHGTFISTVLLALIVGVGTNKTKTIINMVLAFLFLSLEKLNQYIKG